MYIFIEESIASSNNGVHLIIFTMIITKKNRKKPKINTRGQREHKGKTDGQYRPEDQERPSPLWS